MENKKKREGRENTGRRKRRERLECKKDGKMMEDERGVGAEKKGEEKGRATRRER